MITFLKSNERVLIPMEQVDMHGSDWQTHSPSLQTHCLQWVWISSPGEYCSPSCEHLQSDLGTQYKVCKVKFFSKTKFFGQWHPSDFFEQSPIKFPSQVSAQLGMGLTLTRYNRVSLSRFINCDNFGKKILRVNWKDILEKTWWNYQ